MPWILCHDDNAVWGGIELKLKISIKNGMFWETVEFDTDNLDWNGKIKTETDIGWPVIITKMGN